MNKLKSSKMNWLSFDDFKDGECYHTEGLRDINNEMIFVYRSRKQHYEEDVPFYVMYNIPDKYYLYMAYMTYENAYRTRIATKEERILLCPCVICKAL